jgi:hypothetical protein
MVSKKKCYLFLLLLQEVALSHHFVPHLDYPLLIILQVLSFDFHRLHMSAKRENGGHRGDSREWGRGEGPLRNISSELFLINFKLPLHLLQFHHLICSSLDLMHFFVFQQSHLPPHLA